MAGSVNKAVLVGNVGKDPEVRSMQNGDRVASFSLATSESWRDKSGERQDRTTWHNIVVFNDNLVKVAEAYVKKGAKLYVEGAIQHRKFTDRDGNERQVCEIVLQKFRGELQILDGGKQAEEEAPARSPRGQPKNDLDDEIPWR